MGKIKNLTGKKFGKLTVIEFDHADNRKRSYWKCLCDCGTEVIVRVDGLTSRVHSAACMVCSHITHGAKINGKASREYTSWQKMKARCYDKTSKGYEYYGGRGIYVCGEWINSFEQFLVDMGKCPTKFTLERINTNGPYAKDNCKWASVKEQNRNKRNNKLICHDKKIKCLQEWADITGIHRSTISSRLKRGWKTQDLFK